MRILLCCALFIATFQASAQTGPEKVALALCECSNGFEVQKYINLFESNDQTRLRNELDNISEVCTQIKVCAKRSVKLTPEEGRKVPENEIAASLQANCPEVDQIFTKNRELRIKVEKEQEKVEIDERFKIIDVFVASKQKDSVKFHIDNLIYYFGRNDLFVFKIIESYYRVGDFVNGNSEAEILIDGLNDGYYLYDSREDKSIPFDDYARTLIVNLAEKYKQNHIVERAKSKQESERE